MRVNTGIVALAVGLAAAACSTRSEAPNRPIVPELEVEVVRATAPEAPLHILFDWTAREPDARFTGRGVARVEPPYRARLDLFGPRGEGYLSAAVVDGDLRMPRNVAPNAVPPAPLLWSVLGVVLPPDRATLVGASRDGDETRLDFEREGERWMFLLKAGRLRRTEWNARGRRYTVELEGTGPHGLPRKAVYRDWAAFTELTLELDEVERVEPFAPEIWTPDAP